MFNYSFEFYFAKNSFNILRKKIYPNFLIKKCSITHSNFISKKIYLNFLIKKNVQLLIRILFREKFIQYTSEKNLSKFYFAKKYSDYLLVLRRHVLRETFY